MNKLRFIFILLLLLGVTLLSFTVYKGEVEKRYYKEDLVELSKVKYGIFSVDEWKSILEEILTKKIQEFNFDELPKDEIRKKVSEMLYKMTGDLESSFKEEKGLLPKAVANITGIFDKLDDQVPQFTETIMLFIEDPQNREMARSFALTKLDQLTDRTFSEIDYTTYDDVIERHGCKEPDVVIADLTNIIDANNKHYHPYRIALFILAFITSIMIIFSRRLSKHELFFLTVICFVFLATGLSLPMIEIDARISEMRFALLGEIIHFQNQILYYKNKSIIEVVEVMITQERLDLIAVGGLVLLFSVMFPLAKLIASTFYLYSPKVRDSKFVKFVIFRTGKWSMADVMVLAIFMAFIGFSGILREQLEQIEVNSQTLELLTTNASHLQVGFYAFLSFAVLSLLLAHKLQYSFKGDKKEILEEQIEEVEEKQIKEIRKVPSRAKG